MSVRMSYMKDVTGRILVHTNFLHGAERAWDLLLLFIFLGKKLGTGVKMILELIAMVKRAPPYTIKS